MKIIQILADSSYLPALKNIAEKHDAADYWAGPEGEDGRQEVRLLVTPEKRQDTLDALQATLGHSDTAKWFLLSIEAALPRPEEKEPEKKEKVDLVTASREELYNSVEKSARLESNYLLLVLLSTIVVAIGLLEDNVAVVIGAMVIAPLLGPNIALALGTALGDTSLMLKSLKTTLAGLTLALGLSFLIGKLWPLNFESKELLTRTYVGLDSAALAFASGAAAVLSLTTGLPSVLVGVMVAVALLPPTATLGLMLGAGKWELATGAGLLLAVNIVCVNLAAKISFLYRGIKPRTWLEKQKARQSMGIYILIWILSLAILLFAIYLRQNTPLAK
ncbi:MAG: hypothetical protein NPINA01_16410 [Nitrospinaceae bacterium]|nr:MAG: hypothetical protein NPINA01_16410 [Nitrospinaceae bacterium]